MYHVAPSGTEPQRDPQRLLGFCASDAATSAQDVPSEAGLERFAQSIPGDSALLIGKGDSAGTKTIPFPNPQEKEEENTSCSSCSALSAKSVADQVAKSVAAVFDGHPLDDQVVEFLAACHAAQKFCSPRWLPATISAIRTKPASTGEQFLRWVRGCAAGELCHKKRGCPPSGACEKHQQYRCLDQLVERVAPEVSTLLVAARRILERWHGEEIRREEETAAKRAAADRQQRERVEASVPENLAKLSPQLRAMAEKMLSHPDPN